MTSMFVADMLQIMGGIHRRFLNCDPRFVRCNYFILISCCMAVPGMNVCVSALLRNYHKNLNFS